MAVPFSVTKEFLERRLGNSGLKVKRFTHEALRRKIERLDPPEAFTTQPYKHQLACFLLALRYSGYLFLLDMGLGKTKIMLDVFHYRKMQDSAAAKRMLVLVPGRSNVGTWEDEAAIHTPSLSVVGLGADMGRARRQEVLADESADVVVVTYQGLLALTTRKARTAAGKTIPDIAAFKAFGERFGTVVLDECTAIKNHRTQIFRAVKKLRKACDNVYGLTGTPMDKSPHDLWAQFNAVDNGETLGATLGLYRSAFFTEKPGYFGGAEYRFKTELTEKLGRVMANRAVRYAAEECLDLPPVVSSVRRVVMDQEILTYHEKLVTELQEVGGNFTLVENVYHRMRSLTAGWLKVIDPEGAAQIITFKRNPKLEALVELLQEIPEGEKVVVFCVYQKSGELISQALKAAKIASVRLYGKTKNPPEVVRKYTTGKTRVLVASQAGALGLNLQAANHTVFFESFDSSIDDAQAEKRTHRSGQTRKTFFYRLAVAGSVDERILDAVAGGRSLLKDLVDRGW